MIFYAENLSQVLYFFWTASTVNMIHVNVEMWVQTKSYDKIDASFETLRLISYSLEDHLSNAHLQ